jgi:hypothetical protein
MKKQAARRGALVFQHFTLTSGLIFFTDDKGCNFIVFYAREKQALLKCCAE